MLVWLSWQSSSLVMSRSPVRIRPQAPKRKNRRRAVFLFLQSLSGVEVYAPLWGKSGHKLQKAAFSMREDAAFLLLLTQAAASVKYRICDKVVW